MMVEVRERILEVLNKTHLMSLGTCDNEGPWVADIIFIYDEDFNLYWMSDADTRHSRAILNNANVAGSITYSTKSKEPNFGIQFEGVAEQLPGVQFQLLVKHLAKRAYPKPKLSHAKKILDGDLWYKVTPSKIFLIDEENFGYDRQSFAM